MISIIGAGKVGSAAAFEILRFKISDVVLIDLNENQAKGEALDMMQAAPAIEFDGEIKGTGNFKDMEGSDLVIITAGKGRTPDMTRSDLLNFNAKVVKSLTKEIVRYAPDCKIMVVTNPVDIMTYIAYKESGFPRNRVFGMGNILDTHRFRTYIAAECGVSREDTRALVIGEHGDSMVPLIDFATVSGIPISDLLSEQQLARVVEATVSSGADVIALKGSTVYAPAGVIAIMADAIFTGRNRVMSVSTILDGEYGHKDLSIGVPVVLGRNGVEKIVELELTQQTRACFENSVNKVRESLSLLKE
jgi:malate dehydrogenase